MKFGVKSRTNTPYPNIIGVSKEAIGECHKRRIPSHGKKLAAM